ncbi:glycosyltransferase [Salipiger sp.]|uniref:rhamnosyltransferase WsaF family glycosyltransferase n=1 Tax=Salipiger sp. TaxID=2078585 RepID=UPI003A96B08D
MSAPSAPLVFVVMAVFRPDPEHLRAQLASIAAQSHRDLRLVVVIADRVSEDILREAAAAAGLSDPAVVIPENTLDAVRAFEAGIAEAVTRIDALPAGTEALIALSDQDDIWYPDRLARGVARLAEHPELQLVHGDGRLVGPDGTTELKPSMFAFERRHRAPGLRGLLYRNNITGMTLLMRPRVARLALPFPPQSGVHFYHDLWLGLLASATGGVGLVPGPLVDYRQHGNNVMGAVDREAGWLSGRMNAGKRVPLSMWLRREAAAYGLARYLAHSTQNRLAEAVQDGRLKHGEAHSAALRPYLRRVRGAGGHLLDAAKLLLTGHPDLARIAAGFAVVSAGRVIWTLREALGPGLEGAIGRFDTRLYSLSPGADPAPARREEGDKPAPRRRATPWKGLIDIRKEPGWTPEFGSGAPEPAYVLMVPTLNPTEIFAGIDTALEIGLGIAARGMHVRIIATDLPVSSYAASRAFVMRRLSGTGAEDRVSLHCGVTSETLPAHRGDIFLATAWWTAHVAEKLIRRHGFAHPRFHYLVQDFEPNFYAWGPEFADAMASYDFDFEPLFNTTLLRDYFAGEGFGFARGETLAFRPSIDIDRYARGKRPERAATAPRKLALYGRPEVPRNMYTTAIEALGRFVEAEGLTPEQIELVSVGLRHDPVALPGGLELRSLGKLPWEEYPGFLLGCDLGLSLMFSPHPSHPPIEMAASGMRVVTNHFGPKDLSRLTPAIESVEATGPALAAALSRAWHAGPVTPEARAIDLASLGLPRDALIDLLAEKLAPALMPAAGAKTPD